MNRNKRSIALDLKTDAGRDVLHRLAASADALVESYRPGTAARLGVGYDDLAPVNPRLVYASISGFGATGPYAERGGYDIITQGMSGIMSVTGEAGGAPAKAGVPLTDVGAGMLCAFGILAALAAREHTGRGQLVDTSLYEAGLAYAGWESTELWSENQTPGPLGSAHRMSAPYQAIRAADGHFTIGAFTDRLWREAATVFGHPEWTEDQRFATGPDRLANRHALIDEIEAVTTTEAAEVWLERLHAAGVPAGPVSSYAEALADEHTLGARDGGRGGTSIGGYGQDAGHSGQAFRDSGRSSSSAADSWGAHRRDSRRAGIRRGRRRGAVRAEGRRDGRRMRYPS